MSQTALERLLELETPPRIMRRFKRVEGLQYTVLSSELPIAEVARQ